MNKISRHFVIAAALLALTACSGSDAAPAPLDTEAPNTTVEPPESSTPATAAETTTTEPAATTTTPTTTTGPPSTTEPPATEEALIAGIEADLNRGEQQLLASGADPSAPDALTSVEPFFGGDSYDQIAEVFTQLIDNGWTVRANPEVPSVIVVLEVLEASESNASVRLCRIDAGVVIIPPNGESSEILVNDRVVKYETRTDLTLEDGTWKTLGGERISEQVGETTCP